MSIGTSGFTAIDRASSNSTELLLIAHYHHLYSRISNYHPGETDPREKDLLGMVVVQRGIVKKTTINIYIKSMPIISYIWQQMRTGFSHVQNDNVKINCSSTSLMYTQHPRCRNSF